MSPYALHLAHARLEALHALVHALRAADTPAERRRCATAILNAPDPCEIDDALAHTPGMSESSSESRGCAPNASPQPNPLLTSPLPPPTSNLPSPPTASPEDLAKLRSLMSADDAAIDRALIAEPRLMTLLTPANLAAARELPP